MGEKNAELQSEIPRGENNNSSMKPTYLQWRDFIIDLRKQWKVLWRCRIDDKLRAEGIAREDYPMLFVDRGTVIIATKKYKSLDFAEILNLHQQITNVGATFQTLPSFPGWGKFIRTVIRLQHRSLSRGRYQPVEAKHRKDLQKKKGGRGWVHRF
jgi:hypothetical protein